MTRYLSLPPPKIGNELPHQIAARQRRARDQMRKLLLDLPHEEAAAHASLITASEAAIEARRAEELKHTIVWDKVPPEVKNMIYKYLMTQESPIVPDIKHPHAPYPDIRKFDLGGNFLRCNKAIYKESVPILLGDNTFELTHYLGAYLGSAAQTRRDREKLVRKVICRPPLNLAARRSLSRLVNLKELTIIAGRRGRLSEVGNDESQWESRSAMNASLSMDQFLRGMVSDRPRISYHIVYEHVVGYPKRSSKRDI